MLSTLPHALNLYFRYWGWILIFSLVTGIPLALGNVLWAPFYYQPTSYTEYNWGETILRSLERILIQPITAGAIIYFLAAREKNECSGFLDSLQASIRAWPIMASARFFIEGVLFLSWNVLTLPGPYFYVKYSMVDVYIMLEGSSRSAALQNSFDLTEGRFWKLLAVFCVAACLMCPLYIELPFETSLLHHYGKIGYFLGSLGGATIFSFIHVLNWSIYRHLKSSQPTSGESMPLYNAALLS